MAAGDGVKTIASRTHSTLGGHPEVNKDEIHRFFPLLAHTKFASHILCADYMTAYNA